MYQMKNMRESTKSLLKELRINEKGLEKIEASMPRKISEDSDVKIRRVYDIFERLEDDTLVMVPYISNVPMFSPDGKLLEVECARMTIPKYINYETFGAAFSDISKVNLKNMILKTCERELDKKHYDFADMITEDVLLLYPDDKGLREQLNSLYESKGREFPES